MDDRPTTTSRREGDAASLPAMEPGEDIVAVVPGLGARLVITTARAIVIREGASFRPRSGVRSWPIAAVTAASLTPLKHGQGRIVLAVGPGSRPAVNVFIDSPDWPTAERAVNDLRERIHRAARMPDDTRRGDAF
jgi:hypothetical protein